MGKCSGLVIHPFRERAEPFAPSVEDGGSLPNGVLRMGAAVSLKAIFHMSFVVLHDKIDTTLI